MRIVMIVSAHFPPREGMGFYIWNLSRFLAKQGHQVDIITRGGFGRTRFNVKEGITIWRPTFLPVYPYHVHFHNIYVEKVLRQLAGSVDLIHLHTPLVRLPKTKLPTLVTVHNPMKAEIKVISVNNILGKLIRLQAPFSMRLEHNLFDRANKITAVASSVASELTEYGVDPQQVCVLGNGVDTDIFYPQSEARDTVNPYFLTVSRLGLRKGLVDLVQCAALVTKEYPGYRFLIAGSGPLQGELEREIARHCLGSRVILLGHVRDRSQLVRLYQGATAYVHPAHYEGLATALLEAMACGKPVVTTAVSGALDVIQDEQNGLLVPPHVPHQMAQAIKRLIQEPGYGSRLGVSACQTIETGYSWAVVSRNYVAQYESLLKGRRN